MLFHVVLSEELVKLFQEDEGENGVRSETEEVRSESLPESEESLLTDELLDAIHAAAVFATPTMREDEYTHFIIWRRVLMISTGRETMVQKRPEVREEAMWRPRPSFLKRCHRSL